MVISIIPHERDSFNDLSTLSIKYKNGTVDTPNRIVTRNDLNAKKKIGADIPLTQYSKSFMIQESIPPDKIKNILTKNGYLAQILENLKETKNRTISTKPLTLFYPSLTIDSLKIKLTKSKQQELIEFFCDVAHELELEVIVLPHIMDITNMNKIVSKRNLQMIPVLDLQNKQDKFVKHLDICQKLGSVDIPIIALKFATYPKANLAYKKIISISDKLHEKKFGLMMVNAPRTLRGENDASVSGPHYSSIFSADLTVERYYTGGGTNTNPNIRLFCSSNLAAPVVKNLGNKFNIENEKKQFPNNKELQELLERMATNRFTEQDVKNGRSKALSRIHENLQTRLEFEKFRKNISSNSAKDYLKDKPDMNKVVNEHLKEKNTKLM